MAVTQKNIRSIYETYRAFAREKNNPPHMSLARVGEMKNLRNSVTGEIFSMKKFLKTIQNKDITKVRYEKSSKNLLREIEKSA